MITLIIPGIRVALTLRIDNVTAVVEAGETGTVTKQTPECTWVRLDHIRPELAEWDNVLEVWSWPGLGFPLVAC